MLSIADTIIRLPSSCVFSLSPYIPLLSLYEQAVFCSLHLFPSFQLFLGHSLSLNYPSSVILPPSRTLPTSLFYFFYPTLSHVLLFAPPTTIPMSTTCPSFLYYSPAPTFPPSSFHLQFFCPSYLASLSHSLYRRHIFNLSLTFHALSIVKTFP
jgi:hypothetical protein